jgi:hydrogenase maturation protease
MIDIMAFALCGPDPFRACPHLPISLAPKCPDPESDPMPATTLILGIGNTLFADEGVGVEVVRRLEAAGDLEDVAFIDGGTLSFTLAAPIADSPRLIVVDAAILGEPPGTVRVFEGQAMDRQLSGKGKSVHEVSLMDLMDIARFSDTLPEHRALVGIEPAVVDWGDSLTPQVEAAVPQAMAAVRAILTRWDAAAAAP